MENVKFEVIKKNGKPFMRMISYGRIIDMMIYKAKTEKPYVRYCGQFFYLDSNMKQALDLVINGVFVRLAV